MLYAKSFGMVSYLTIIKQAYVRLKAITSFGMVSYLTIIKPMNDPHSGNQKFWYGVIFNYY